MRRPVIAACLCILVALTGCRSMPRPARPLSAWIPDVPGVDVSAAVRASEAAARAQAEPPAARAERRGAPVPTTQGPSGPVVAEEAAGEDAPTPASLGSRRLRAGDRIIVDIRAVPVPQTLQYVIDDEGSINLPHIGRMAIAGMTAGECEKLIEKTYIDEQIYKRVTVTVIPPENEFYVMGYVYRPGSFPINRDLTVMRAVSMAGGCNEFADPKRVRLTRGEEVIVVNLIRVQELKDPDPAVEPGDVIFVPKGRI